MWILFLIAYLIYITRSMRKGSIGIVINGVYIFEDSVEPLRRELTLDVPVEPLGDGEVDASNIFDSLEEQQRFNPMYSHLVSNMHYDSSKDVFNNGNDISGF